MNKVNKWGKAPNSRTVAWFHTAVAALVEERLAASGRRWEDAVWDDDLALDTSDFQRIEAALLATGIRFEMSAGISLAEAPQKYEAPPAESSLDDRELDEHGRCVAGHGDNVFHVDDDIVGVVQVVSSVDTVMELLASGVPPGTVAIIDDSGGTLTAPILDGFTAVVCKGGSVRSHLGILTREYKIPCLMNSEVTGLRDGDRVQIEYSVPAKPPYADANGLGRARVWKLP